MDKSSVAFQTIHIDHLRPLVTTRHKNKYVVAIICDFSKYVILKAVKEVETKTTIQCVKKFMAHYGKELRIISWMSCIYLTCL